MLAPDERRKALAVQRFEPTLGAARTHNSESCKRLGEAFDALRAEVGQLEQAAQQPPRGRR